MKRSTQLIEWLMTSKFANRTPVSHMFWVTPSETYNRSDGLEQTIDDLCIEIEQLLQDERDKQSSGNVQDWYIWHYYLDQKERRCVFTQMPPIPSLDNRFPQLSLHGTEQLNRIKELLPSYIRLKTHHHSGRILATDGILSWLHPGTGLQWTTFSYLHSERSDHAEVLNELCYAGHQDWRLPTISEIRTMFSADKEISEWSEHPLAGTLPSAMSLPLEETPQIGNVDELRGYYVFDEEITVTTGTRYNRSDKRIDIGKNYSYSSRFLAVRGDRKVQRSFQTGWAGTLLAWTEKNLTLVEQGQLPGSATGWKRLEKLMLRGEHFSNGNYEAAFAAMRYLTKLRDIYLTLDKSCKEIPNPLYRLPQVKRLYIRNGYGSITEVEKWSITYISSDIEHMTGLEELNLSWQIDLREVPNEIFELPNLTSLDFGGCWNLVLSTHQVQRICDLTEAGVHVFIPPLRLNNDNCRKKLLQAVEENSGKIGWADMKHLTW